MKEKPILFSGPMVRAILDGRKTQTRRIVKMTKDEPLTDVCWGYTAFTPDRCISFRGLHANGQWGESFIRQPYFKGDRLWVKETQWINGGFPATDDSSIPNEGKKPAIFCRRIDSRITLEITNVRVERLQEISEADVLAEGLVKLSKDQGRTFKFGKPDRDGLPGGCDIGWPWDEWKADHAQAFGHAWDKINGKKHPWDSNPFVWVVEFKQI